MVNVFGPCQMGDTWRSSLYAVPRAVPSRKQFTRSSGFGIIEGPQTGDSYCYIWSVWQTWQLIYHVSFPGEKHSQAWNTEHPLPSSSSGGSHGGSENHFQHFPGGGGKSYQGTKEMSPQMGALSDVLPSTYGYRLLLRQEPQKVWKSIKEW